MEALRVALVGSSLLFVVLLAEGWRYYFKPSVEVTRKFVHFFSGLIVSFFPWIFTSLWSILALAMIFALILRVTAYLGVLKSVHDVKRSSLGDLYFVASAYSLFLFADQYKIFYMVSMLTLTIADALAAILGKTYKRTTYGSKWGHKSLEGSAVFFFLTFLIVHLPLLLLTDIDRGHCVLMSLQIALIVTCFEAICFGGLDNLIVPFSTFFLLVKLSATSASWIAWQLGSQLLIVAIINVVAWWFQLLTVSGAIGVQLVLYGAFSLGGRMWLIVPLLAVAPVIIVYRLYYRRQVQRQNPKIYQVATVFSVSIVPVALFFANNTFETFIQYPPALSSGDPFYILYVGAIAAHMAIAFIWLLRGLKKQWLVVMSTIISYLYLVPVSLYFQKRVFLNVDLSVTALIMSISVFLAFYMRKQSEHIHVQLGTVSLAVAAATPFYLWYNTN